MAAFDAREIGTEQAAAIFDVALRELLFFAEFAKTVADHHVANYPISKTNKQVSFRIEAGGTGGFIRRREFATRAGIGIARALQRRGRDTNWPKLWRRRGGFRR